MAPARRPEARTHHGDHGVSVIEYAAVIILAGVILAGAGLFVIRNEVASNVPPALCYLLGGGMEECKKDGEGGGDADGDGDDKGPKPSPPSPGCPKGDSTGNKEDEKFKPELCEKLYEKQWSKSTYSLWFIKVSKELAFIKQEYSDGTVRLTAISTDSVGVEIENDLNVFTSGDVKLGGKLGGSLDMKFGDTYVFDDMKEADGEIDKIKSWYDKKDFDQSRQRSKVCLDNPGAKGCIPDDDDEDKGKPFDKEPAITTKSIGGSGSVSLNFGKVDGGGKGKGDKDKDKNKDNVDEASGSSLSLNLLGGKGKLAGETVEETDKSDPKNPKTSRIYSFTVDGSGSGGMLQGKGTKNVSLKVTKDKDGKLIGVALSEAVESPDGAGFEVEAAGSKGPINGSYGKNERKGRYDARSASLEVTDDNREMVEEWLAGQGGGDAKSGDEASEIGEPVDLDDDSTPWDRVKKEFYDHGKVSKVLYDTEYKSESAGFGVSFLGMDFGVAMEWGSESREAVEADYLGAPNGDDPRKWVDFPECVKNQDKKQKTARHPDCPATKDDD